MDDVLVYCRTDIYLYNGINIKAFMYLFLVRKQQSTDKKGCIFLSSLGSVLLRYWNIYMIMRNQGRSQKLTNI